MSKIVLFEPMYYGKRRMVQRAPLALLAISGLLDSEGYSISIVSKKLYGGPFEKILNECKDAICFGVTALTGYQITEGLEISRSIKKYFPNLPIVWGGWHPSLDPTGTVSSVYVDYVVRGQGERAFYELVKALERKNGFEDIAGLSYKKNGKVFHNPDRDLEDLNSFPPLPFQLINVEKALSNDEYGDRVINYVSSYGCPNDCSFCAEHLVHKKRWTGLNSKRLLDDFERLNRDYGVDCITVNDTQFFLNRERVTEFCNGLIKKRLSVKWNNVEGNIRQLLRWDDDLWNLLVKSGLSSILVGSESGYPEALKFMNKPLTVEETLEFIEKAKKFNIKVLYSMMLGLPWDKDYSKTQRLIDEEIKDTLKLSDTIIKASQKNRVLLCIYTPYPGNHLFQRSIEIGLKPPQSLNGWSRWNLMERTTPWISLKQANLINFISSYLFFFLDNDSYNWVTKRVKNTLIRFFFRRVFKLFICIAKIRWRLKLFVFRVDYKIYLLGRELLKIA